MSGSSCAAIGRDDINVMQFAGNCLCVHMSEEECVCEGWSDFYMTDSRQGTHVFSV